MKTRLAMIPVLLLGCSIDAPTDDDQIVPPGDGKADGTENRNANDVHLVLAEVVDLPGGALHFGELNTNNTRPDVPDQVAAEIKSSQCEFLAERFMASEFDCSEPVLDDVASLRPALAGAPLIYPAMHRGAFSNGKPSLGEYESNTKVIRLVVAADEDALNAASFVGIGFHRIGYEFTSEFPYSAYADGSRGKELFEETTVLNHLVTGKAKRLATGTRESDGASVVFLEYLYFLPQSVKRPWISGSYEWMPASSGVNVKPFAQFHANGVISRNWDPRNITYRIDHDAPAGIVIDYRDQFAGLTP